jgi:2-amino-4-hydroxy-6-hydroxymethyldihydropteridine diphosphokinase
VTAHVGLGSNEGDRLGQLRRALFALAVHPEISVTAVSRVYETQYVGPGTQSPFLNACAAIRTALPPAVLLAVMQGTEARLGRRPATHMQPRPLDLDLLLYGDLVTADPRLTLPHPRMRERAFVLVPLQEIAAEARLPDSGETVAVACAKIARRDGPWVRPLPDGELWPRPRAGEEREWRAALALHCR